MGALADAINELLVTEGIPGLSLRKIAAVSGVSTSSILHHLGDKDRLLSLSAHLTGRALLDDMRQRQWCEGVGAFLPKADDDVLAIRAWLAWIELSRSDARVEAPVARLRDDQRHLLAITFDHRLERDDLYLTAALIEGLWSAICAPVRPLPPPRALTLLHQHLRRLGVPVTRDAEGP